MYHILPKSQDNIIGILIEEQMSKKDYATLLLFLENMIKKHKTINLLLNLNDLKSIELSGILKSFSYTFKFRSRIEKISIVTNQKWIYTWAKILAPFFKSEVRCFQKTKIEQAWEWLKK